MFEEGRYEISVKMACGHTEKISCWPEDVNIVIQESAGEICSKCTDEQISKLRVCQVCSKIVAEEMHCHEMTGPLPDNSRDDLDFEDRDRLMGLCEREEGWNDMNDGAPYEECDPEYRIPVCKDQDSPYYCERMDALCSLREGCDTNTITFLFSCSRGMVLCHDADDETNRMMYHQDNFTDDLPF